MAAASFSRVFAVSSIVVVFLTLVSFSEAREHLIGGKTDSWKIPPSKSDDSFNRWSSMSRFLVGDSLVWKYDGSKDSVLQVNKKDYVNCNTTSPIAVYNDGSTVVELDHSGPYYFISGAKGHCEKGQKIIVVVLSERHSRRFMGASPAPSPSGFDEFEGPAVAPTSSAPAFYKGVTWVASLALTVFTFLVMM